MDEVDVLVVGGGVAGLSGALTLARVRRSVLVLDAGEPRNAPADGVHGFLSRDGTPPRELLGVGAEEVARYGGRIVRGRAVTARRVGDRFHVTADDGRTFAARRLLVTTGLVDELPDVPGLRERWGRDVLHCPYCHGWEVRDRRIGVLGGRPLTMHRVLLFRQLSADVTLFRHTGTELADEEWEQLAALGVGVVDGEVTGLEVEDDELRGVRLASGTVVPVRALAILPRFVAAGDMLAGLGLHPVEHPVGMGSHIESGPAGSTAVPGVWVAGNVTDLGASVAISVGAGVAAAAAINADLVQADADAAVRRRREPFGAVAEADNAEHVLGEHRHGLTATGTPQAGRS